MSSNERWTYEDIYRRLDEVLDISPTAGGARKLNRIAARILRTLGSSLAEDDTLAVEGALADWTGSWAERRDEYIRRYGGRLGSNAATSEMSLNRLLFFAVCRNDLLDVTSGEFMTDLAERIAVPPDSVMRAFRAEVPSF